MTKEMYASRDVEYHVEGHISFDRLRDYFESNGCEVQRCQNADTYIILRGDEFANMQQGMADNQWIISTSGRGNQTIEGLLDKLVLEDED